MNDISDKKYPQSGVIDFIHRLVAAGAGSTPVVGRLLELVYTETVPNLLERKQIEFIQMIYDELILLKQKVNDFDFDEIAQNDEFLSTIYSANQSALKARSKEKLKLLRNVVINTILNIHIEEIFKDRILGLIDELSIPHIDVLKKISSGESLSDLDVARKQLDIMQWRFKPDGIDTYLYIKLDTNENNRKIYRTIYNDLVNDGLIETLKDKFSAYYLSIKHTTFYGDTFLKVISDPKY